MNVLLYDPDERAREKAASRERDERLMAEGLVSPRRDAAYQRRIEPPLPRRSDEAPA